MKKFLSANQIIIPSYQHYGGLTGYQDYSINGTKIKNNLIRLWRDEFIEKSSNIHEVDIPTVVHSSVLRASGHVDRFADYVVIDDTGTEHRADHLVKSWASSNNVEINVDVMDANMLENYINSHNILSNKNSRVISKNLMFQLNNEYLRPELAQGIFVNFEIYNSYVNVNDFKPFGIAQIGKSYRKEISPQPFIRMREFTQAELEYFFDPMTPNHNGYESIKNVIVRLWTENMQINNQTEINISIKEAVDSGLIIHELMAYFIVRIAEFAKLIGLSDDKVRFRQHCSNELAHYANQCWDLECLVEGKWLECVGCADRGCYDLNAHSQIQPLIAHRTLSTAIKHTDYKIKALPSKLKEKFKNTEIKKIMDHFDNLQSDKIQMYVKCINNTESIITVIDSIEYDIPYDFFEIKNILRTVDHEIFTPHVIEPSFGIDRLIYAIIDHNLIMRNDRRICLSLVPKLAIYDFACFPLHKKESMILIANKIREHLCHMGLKCFMDDTSISIGKKYVRCDELGVRYVITVDPSSLETGKVTIRERNSMQQLYHDTDSIFDYLITH